MLLIKREESKWGEHRYICRCCDSVADSIARISHNTDCPVQNPDSVVTPFTDSTDQYITETVNEICWRYRDAEFLDNLDDLDNIDGVRWQEQGSSTRYALGLGRTNYRGQYHLPSERGLVMKIDPRIRYDEEYTPISSNIDELKTWEKAVQTDSSHLFADILACANDGMWLIMERCIPVYRSIRAEMKERDAIFDSDGDTYIYPLVDRLKDHNWVDPDYRHGNVGLTDDRTAVLLDYGTGPDRPLK